MGSSIAAKYKKELTSFVGRSNVNYEAAQLVG